VLLPYATDRPPARRPDLTWTLLAVNALLTLLTLILQQVNGPGSARAIYHTFGIVPAHFQPFSLLTYSFFHDGLGHLLTNLFYLWVFGAGVEEVVGGWRFLALYLLGGAVGGVLETLVIVVLLPGQAAEQPIVGASAACAGLVGLFAVRYYRARLSFVGLPWRPQVVAVVGLFLAFEIGTGLWDIFTGYGAGGVAHWAHVGGFIFGLVWGQAFGFVEVGERAYLKMDAARAMARNVPGAAIRRWEKLLERDPENMTARLELARAWLLLGDTEQSGSHYQHALRKLLRRRKRAEAARLYAEIRDHDLRAPTLPASELFPLGVALEESEQYALAAETLRSLTVHSPDAPEAELALLKVITLYAHQLNRREEAQILLRVFLDRYPHSQWRSMAEEMMT